MPDETTGYRPGQVKALADFYRQHRSYEAQHASLAKFYDEIESEGMPSLLEELLRPIYANRSEKRKAVYGQMARWLQECLDHDGLYDLLSEEGDRDYMAFLVKSEIAKYQKKANNDAR